MNYIIENKQQTIYAGNSPYLTDIPNIHHHLELIYMLKGSTLATVDNKDYLLEEGDLFLVFPHQIHFFKDQGLIERYIVIFSPDIFPELKEVFQYRIATAPVLKANQFQHKITHVKSRLRKILELCRSDEALDYVIVKGYIMALLGEMLPLMNLIPRQADHDRIKSILNYCSSNYVNSLTLDLIADDLHMNKYYISHIFKERMNMGIMEYVNSLRIDHSLSMLKKGASITDVAFTCGFSSVRSFNRVFAQKMGMAPRDFIKTRES